MNIFDAVRAGDAEIVNVYLKHGGDVNNSLKTGSTLLMIAATYGQTDIVKILIGSGAGVNAVNYDGMTALMYSISKMGSAETLKLLIDAKADVNASFKRSNTAGATALLLAASMGLAEMVRLLIDAGADVHAKDNFGDSPCSRAVQFGHAEIAEMLKVAGAEE
jgi:ankyrin repeat protein